jgi:arylsulfatase A-like enzyme
MRRFLLLSLLVWQCASAATAANKPNVIVFLTDDVGWGEYGFQGGNVPTPNIDSIAKNGVRFTQGYVSGPYCSPTRAGLMTGRYQTRFGHEFNSVARHAGLSLKETTIAKRMKSLGYATCAVGKWHLGQLPEYGPWQRGFDEFFGTLNNTPFFHPTNFVDTRVSREVQAIEDKDFYTTDKYAERAVDFIAAHKGKPWFLYLPFNAQHAPLQAPQKYLDRFADLKDEKRQIFAAMMSATDDAVGKVLAQVRKDGEEENSIIFFLADNGGPTLQTTSSNGPLRGFKATTWEGGVRVPFCMQWKGHIEPGQTYTNPIIQLDILPTVVAAAGDNVDPAWKLDGVDLLPYLTGKNQGKPHETLYWRFGEQWAIRHGDHKLVVGRLGSGSPELYDLSKDISESTDLVSNQPDKAKELDTLWKRWNAEQAPPSFPNQPAGKAKGKGKGKGKTKTKQS